MSEAGVGLEIAEPIIKVRGLTKVYRVGDVEVHALRGIDLDSARGEFVAIVGASGSGKSTLFHILGGLTPPTSGSVVIDGKDLSGMSNSDRTELRKSTVGFVFQKYNLLPTLSAEDNIKIVEYIGGRSTTFTPEFQEVLKLLGILDRMKHKPRALSGGQQQRVAIARALVNNPLLLLADEPTGNLDSKTSIEVIEIFQRLNLERNLTILLVTHEPDIAQYAARRIVFLDGRIRVDESVVGRRTASADLSTIATVEAIHPGKSVLVA
jgi:putative ABC transport system ATP-binding protein